MAISKIEVEAKFIVPDLSAFARLQKLSRLGDFELQPMGTQTLTDHYLDTADRRLYQAGFAYRLRISHAKQVLTLKSLTPAAGPIHRRQEVEVEPGGLIGLEDRARELVLEMIGQQPLQTLFTLFQTRHQFHALWQNQPVIEFSLDEVSLHDPATVDYYELEAERIEAGTEADLIRFIDTLQASWSLSPETRSKFERALASTFSNFPAEEERKNDQ